MITGTVAAGFEPVRDAFERGASDLGKGGGAFSAYVAGRLVVDLWTGQARPGKPWAEDTLGVLMSTTKGFVAVSAQILHDRGRLDLDAPVATYWPEFAQAGKQDVTVRQVLTHTAGVLGFPNSHELLRPDGTGWDDYDAIAARLAAAEPAWEPGTRCGYHALSYGWLVGEIVRRITGETIGTFFRTEVAEPLGLDAHIGTPADVEPRVVRVIPLLEGLPDTVVALYDHMQSHVRDPQTRAGQAFLASDGSSGFDHLEALMNDPSFLALEFPAGNGTATARSLAKMYAMLASDGELDGVRIVSPESVKTFGEVQVREPDALYEGAAIPGLEALQAEDVPRSLGYLGNGGPAGMPMRFGPSELAYGHDGFGGQTGFCDPDHGVGVGFVRNDLAIMSFVSAQLIGALYACIGV